MDEDDSANETPTDLTDSPQRERERERERERDDHHPMYYCFVIYVRATAGEEVK